MANFPVALPMATIAEIEEAPVAIQPLPVNSRDEPDALMSLLSSSREPDRELPADRLTLNDSVFEGLRDEKMAERCQEIVALVRGAHFASIDISPSFYQRLHSRPEDMTAFCDGLLTHTKCQNLTVGTPVWDTTFGVGYLRSIAEMRGALTRLLLWGGRVQQRSEINALCSSVETLRLRELTLDVSCCLQDYPIAYRCLDVLLDSIDVSCLERLSLGAVSLSASPLVSVDGLERFLQRLHEDGSTQLQQLTLQGLNLTDAHVQVLCRELSGKASLQVHLLDQPHLTSQALDRLYHCINTVVDFPHIQIDDAERNSRFVLARKMNDYGRQHYMTRDGSFLSKEDWVEWMARLASCRDDPTMLFTSFEDLSSILLCVHEHVDMLQR